MQMKHLSAAVAVIVLIAGTAAGAAPGFFNLGAGSSTGISTDGTVVAANLGANACIWSQTYGVKVLGTGTTAGVATTSDGQVIVGGRLGGTTTSRWNGTADGVGSWTTLPLVGGTTDWIPTWTSAKADGTEAWIGGYTNQATGSKQAMRWKKSTNSSTALQLPSGGNKDAYIYGVSDDGYYAGRYQYGGTSPSGSRQAMGGSTLIALNNLMGAPSTSNEAVANTISRNHMVIGGWSSYPGGPSGYRQALIWSGPSWSVLTAIPFIGTDNYSETQALNGDGSIAAGYARDLAAGTRRAWIWDATNGVQDLAVYLTAQGMDLTGWALTDVKGMSADGKVLTGNGTYLGTASAWVAVIPEPSSFLALGTGLIGLVGIGRRARRH